MAARTRRYLHSICLLALGACNSGIVPATPRVARGGGSELALGALRGGSGLRVDEDRQLDVHVRAIAPRTRVLAASVQVSAQPACSGGVAATRVRVPGDPWTNRRRPRPGETLLIDLPGAAWRLAVSAPSRLDLVLRDANGALQCASFALVDSAPEHRWRPLESWTLSGLFQYEAFLDRVAGLDGASSFGLAAGRWLGPLRVSAGAGVGVAWCTDANCRPEPGDTVPRSSLYVPGFVGLDATLFQVAALAFELAAQYKLAWAEPPALGESTFLHGPELIPRLAWALRDPLAPGIPGGPRRGYAISFAVPMGYIMAASGDVSLSIGGALLASFPVR
jgi:hypothetical protein